MREEAHGRGKEDLCAFCREPPSRSDEEIIKQTQKLIGANNARAFYMLAGCYEHGMRGMPQDFAKANDLYLRAGELGCAEGYYNFGHSSYDNGGGVEVDKKKAKYYWELAAMSGSVKARHNLGCEEVDSGNIDRAYKHFLLAANAGFDKSLGRVKKGFMDGIVTKEEYANTLRAYQQRHDEMKSEDRDIAYIPAIIQAADRL